MLCNVCLPASAQFTKAVEMKQVAEQDAERAKFVVLKAEQVREAFS
jgi:prohibitin 1